MQFRESRCQCIRPLDHSRSRYRGGYFSVPQLGYFVQLAFCPEMPEDISPHSSFNTKYHVGMVHRGKEESCHRLTSSTDCTVRASNNTSGVQLFHFLSPGSKSCTMIWPITLLIDASHSPPILAGNRNVKS